MSRWLLATMTLTLLGGAAGAQDKPIFFDVPDSTKRSGHDSLLREALPKEPADAPLTDALRESINFLARFHVFKLAPSNTNLAKSLRDDPKNMSTLVADTEAFLNAVFPPPDRKDFVKNVKVQEAFLEQMLKNLEPVIQNAQQYPIVRVNAARILARVAQSSGAEVCADLLVKCLADTQQIDGVRYYACQGLKELMRRTAREGPPIKDANRRAAVVTALVAFVERKPPFTTSTVYEVEGLRMVRREGIRALAETREPRIAGSPQGHAALCLARVVARDVLLVPEPRLDEQIEAAIGLARMKNPEGQDDFQYGYAAHLLGTFVVRFGVAHKDRATVENSGREPWKIHGARLEEALKDMVATSREDATTKSIQIYYPPIFAAVLGNKDTATDELRRWLESNRPAQTSIYKSDPKSAVNPRVTKAE